METFTVFSTTADVGIKIQGEGYSGLYQSAIKGINLLLFGDKAGELAGPGSQIHPFDFTGDSAENVLVNLLSEVVFLLQSRARITTGLDIKKISEAYLRADLQLCNARIEPGMEIKSVTYHNLKIIGQDGIKSAEIIFDI